MGKSKLLGKIIKIQQAGSKAVIAAESPVDDDLLSSVNIYFLEIEGKLVPFFPETHEVRGDKTILVRFEDYADAGRLMKIAGCRVFIAEPESGAEKAFTVNDLNGYALKSGDSTLNGVIISVNDNGESVVLEVLSEGGRKLLIPYHEDLVLELNPGRGEIKMDLPEGLADLNI